MITVAAITVVLTEIMDHAPKSAMADEMVNVSNRTIATPA